MNDQERNMIEGLFQRLAQAETQAGPRDVQAEAMIQGLVSRQPVAPYMMAQVVLMQEQGLANLQTRITELEQELAARPQAQSSGFLGGLFGGGKPQPAAPVTRTMPAQPATGGGWGNSPAQGMAMQPGMRPGMQPGAQGGGFMAGAMQTAMGVAGGMLLANAVSGMFGSEAQAAETPAAAPTPEPEAQEESGGEEDGGLFGGFFGGGDEEEF